MLHRLRSSILLMPVILVCMPLTAGPGDPRVPTSPVSETAKGRPELYALILRPGGAWK